MLRLICWLAITFSLNAVGNENSLLQVRTIAVAPYGMITGAKLGGIYFELTELLLTKNKIQNKHYIDPYARIMHELKIGKTDLTIMFKYPELAPFVTYISPLPALKNVIIARKEDPSPTIEGLHGKVIAYLRGAKFSDAVDNNSSISKQEVMDFNQGIILLQKGRVDAIIGPLDPIKSAAKKLYLKADFFGEPLVVSQRTPWLQVSNKSLNKVSVGKLKASFSALLQQGELDRLKVKYQ